MIRDPQFNPLYAAQTAPWGASSITPFGYVVSLKALHSEVPQANVQGSFDSPLEPKPEERLEVHAAQVCLVDGTWTQIGQASSTGWESDDSSVSPVSPVSPMTASMPVTPATPVLHLAPTFEDDK